MNSPKLSTDASSPFVTLSMAQRALSSAPSSSSLKNLRTRSSPKADENSFGLPSISTAVSLNATSSNCRAESSSGCTYSSAGSLSEAASGFTRGYFLPPRWRAGQGSLPSPRRRSGVQAGSPEKKSLVLHINLCYSRKKSQTSFSCVNRTESLLPSGKEV